MKVVDCWRMMKERVVAVFRKLHLRIVRRKLTDTDVIALQEEWGRWIVLIGEKHRLNEDYKTATELFIKHLYCYPDTALFKPTKSSIVAFRDSWEGAVSYMIGGRYEEDKGFALAPWSNVKWENTGMIHTRDISIAMGRYTFTNAETMNDVEAFYTLGIKRTIYGNRIVVHHSSFPYKPPEKTVDIDVDLEEPSFFENLKSYF